MQQMKTAQKTEKRNKGRNKQQRKAYSFIDNMLIHEARPHHELSKNTLTKTRIRPERERVRERNRQKRAFFLSYLSP